MILNYTPQTEDVVLWKMYTYCHMHINLKCNFDWYAYANVRFPHVFQVSESL